MSEYNEWKSKQDGKIWHTHCCEVAFTGGLNQKQSEIDQLKTSIQGLGDAVTRQLGIIVDREREIDQLKAQLNNMEQCYIEVKKERDEYVQVASMVKIIGGVRGEHE